MDFDEKDMALDLNMSHGKISNFVLFPSFEFTLDFQFLFWKSLNYFNFGLSFIVWVECWHKVEKYGFKLYQNSLIFFN